MSSKPALYQEALELLRQCDALLASALERHCAHLDSLIAEIDGRFVSGNAIPVERATLKAAEWTVLRHFIVAARAAVRFPDSDHQQQGNLDADRNP